MFLHQMRLEKCTLKSYSPYAFKLKLDVNGKGLPNKDGSDIFELEFDEYGQFTNLLDYTNKDKDTD